MGREPPRSVTARWSLLGEERPAPDVLGRHLVRAGAGAAIVAGLAGLSSFGRGFVQSEVARAIDGLLELDVPHALGAAWSKSRDLEAARQRTRAANSVELIEFAAHQVSSDHPSEIELVVDHVPRQTIDAEIRLVALLRGLTARVARGSVVSLQGGDAELTTTLMVVGVRVAERSATLPASLVLALEAVEQAGPAEPLDATSAARPFVDT